jgi:hypothetical protein
MDVISTPQQRSRPKLPASSDLNQGLHAQGWQWRFARAAIERANVSHAWG